MFSVGQVVQCVAYGAGGIARGKFYVVSAIRDGWVTVRNDANHQISYAQERFRSVDADTLAENGFPDRRDEPARETRKDDPQPAPSREPAGGNGSVILMVDDNADLRATTALHLRKLDYEVLEAGNAVQAMDLIWSDGRIELLFTDILMPGRMNGFDLARAGVAAKADLKVLLTTGFPMMRRSVHGTQPLGWPMLSKPYRTRELARVIAELLQTRHAMVET